ncbi:hypothetical protein E3A20_06200, partial [Planctomyces bekefii]
MRFSVLLSLSLVFAEACTRNPPELAQSLVINVVSGDQLKGEVGSKFKEPVVLQVMDSGAPLPGMTVYIQNVDWVDGDTNIPTNINITDEEGKITAYGYGGQTANKETKFRGFIKGLEQEVKFSLWTGDPPPANVKEVEKEVPREVSNVKVEKYSITTEHQTGETAGVPFGINISALNKEGLVVPSYVGEKELTFSLKNAGATADDPTVVLGDSDFAPFAPTVIGTVKVVFEDGVARIPTGEGYTIRKIVPGMFIACEEATDRTAGASEPLQMAVGTLNRIQIVSAETKPQGIAYGTKIPGEHFVNQGGFDILVPSDTAEKAQMYPPFAVSAGGSLALQVDGYDVFENRFPDPMPSIWTAHDVGINVGSFPNPPVIPDMIALRGAPTGMNVFLPTTDALGYLKASHSQRMPNGQTQTFLTNTGVIRVTSDKPTTLLVDLYPATGGALPGPSAVPVSSPLAGTAYWIKLRAASSLGVVNPTFTKTANVSFYIANISRSPGWPLVEDLESGQTRLNNKVATLDLQDLFTDGAGAPSYGWRNADVKFVNGEGWLKAFNAPGNADPNLDNRPPANLLFYKAGEKPIIQVQSVVDELNGQLNLDVVRPGPKANIKLGFNDSISPVPASVAADYPNGIDVGTKLRRFPLEVGRGLVLASFGYDAFGNLIGLTRANWEGINGLPNFYLAYFGTPAKINIVTPDELLGVPGVIKITDVDDVNVTATSGQITTLPGLPARFVVTPSASVVAGTKFGLTVTAVDKAGNVSVGYNNNASIKIKVTGNPLVPPVGFFPNAGAQTAYTQWQSTMAVGLNRSLNFINGVASIPSNDANAFQFFYSSEHPIIQVMMADNSITGDSGSLNVIPEALKSVQAFYLSSLTVDDNGTPVTYAKDAVVENVILNAGVALKLDARGFDRYGNSKGSVNVDWTNTMDDNLAGTAAVPVINYNGNDNNFAILNGSNLTVYTTSASGKAYIKMTTSTDVCAAAGSCEGGGPVVGYTGLVDARVGMPTSVRVTQAVAGDVVAGQPFAMKVELLDVNGQLAQNFNQTITIDSVIVSHTPGETSSVFGFAAVEPNGPIALPMTAGVGLLSGFTINNIYDSPKVNVSARLQTGTVLANNFGESPPINVIAGAGDSVRIVNLPQVEGATNLGVKHRPAIFDSANNPLVVYPTTNMNLYAGYFDLYGNWAGDAVVQWSLPNPNCSGISGAYANNFISHFSTPKA